MSIYQNIEKSKKLAADVEAFLAKQKPIEVAADLDSDIPSGYVVLPPSFTKFPDGNLPRGYDRVVEDKPKPVKEPKKPKQPKPKPVKKPKPPKVKKLRIAKPKPPKIKPFVLVEFPERTARSLNQKINAMRKIVALESGLSEFNGICNKHGNAVFSIISEGQIRCRDCYKFYNDKNPSRSRPRVKKHKEPTPFQLKQAAKNAALARGERSFIYTCDKHGETEYRINRKNSPFCVQCKRDIDNSRNRILAKLSPNRILSDQAFKEGKSRFIGECKVHGKTEFYAFEKRCRCIECKNHANILQQKRQAKINQSNPDTEYLRNKLDTSPYGTSRRLSDGLNINKSTLSAYRSGRAKVPAELMIKVKQFFGD